MNFFHYVQEEYSADTVAASMKGVLLSWGKTLGNARWSFRIILAT